MTKIIATCLLGAGLMAAATTLPQSQAHEGHDHGETFAAPQESLPKTSPPASTNDVVTSPPPFETLDNKPAPTTPSDRNAVPRGPVNQDSRQPQQRPLDRFGQSNPNTDFYNVPRLNSEDGHSHSHDTAGSLDEFPREAYGVDGRGLDRFSPQEAFPARPRFSQSMTERESELYRGHPGSRDTCGYDHADRYCVTEARLPYTTTSSCNLADVDYQHSHSPRIDFNRTDYRQYRDDFHCPGITGSCDSFASQFHY